MANYLHSAWDFVILVVIVLTIIIIHHLGSGTTPKKISVSELGVIFWGSPLFLAVFGHSHVRRATTLNFGPISTKLGGIVRAIKKMTQKDNGPGLGRNYGETGVFTFGRKVVSRAGLINHRDNLCVASISTWFSAISAISSLQRFISTIIFFNTEESFRECSNYHLNQVVILISVTFTLTVIVKHYKPNLCRCGSLLFFFIPPLGSLSKTT